MFKPKVKWNYSIRIAIRPRFQVISMPLFLWMLVIPETEYGLDINVRQKGFLQDPQVRV
jgi:hypothetical protein